MKTIDIKITESINGYRVDLWDGEKLKLYNTETYDEAVKIGQRFLKEVMTWEVI